MSPATISRKHAQLQQRFNECHCNHVYWTRQCELRTHPDSQRLAGIQMIAWKRKLDEVTEQINRLQPSH